jgi:methionyl aminopeptidase
MDKINIKSEADIKIMSEGGKKLSEVKNGLVDAVKKGVSAFEIETLANKLIKKSGGEASFKMVPGYSWATCVNVNDGIVHGIPHKDIVFKDKDVVSIDVGLFYKGFHTDTSITKLIGKDPEKQRFLKTGRKSLEAGIKAFKPGNRVEDISSAIEVTLRKEGLNPISSLTGHGVGKALHEDPRVPCMVLGSRDEEVILREGMVLAIEVMYTMGRDSIKIGQDGWTISTRDGKIAALFEETVALTSRGRIVLT